MLSCLFTWHNTRFNPCFNGRGVKTYPFSLQRQYSSRFNPCFNGRGVKTCNSVDLQSEKQVVSILVLMEEALRPAQCQPPFPAEMGFNPCFNGRGVKTTVRVSIACISLSFNPCFNGRGVKTKRTGGVSCLLCRVSILVLMEEALRLDRCIDCMYCLKVSILVLMEEALRLYLIYKNRPQYIRFQSLF